MGGFHVKNFGCRAARADGEAVSDRLRADGMTEEKPSAADVVVVNTCSVTAEADREARSYIRRAHRLNPAAKIVVTGCYAQRAPEELSEIAGVAAVVGNSHKGLAPEVVLRLAASGRPAPLVPSQPSGSPAETPGFCSLESLLSANPGTSAILVDDRFAHSFLEEAQLTPGAQTRPNLKIQEGCGNRCTFCVIPQTRGSSRSLAAEAVLRQVEGFVAAGGHELVLSGINLGRWGRDLTTNSSEAANRLSLANLARRIFAETGLARLRLSSIEPMDWDAEMIALMADFARPASGPARLARHAHLPLQSGSDGVLRRMHRRYRPWHYVEKVEALLRAAGSELTLGADVMAGFPGETDAEFEETLALIRSLPFGYLHLFPFSPRPGTPGWEMHREHPVPATVVDQRMAALRALAAEKTAEHRKKAVGTQLEAITLHTPADLSARGRTAALTENFLPVELRGSLPANQLVRVSVTAVIPNTDGGCDLQGELAAS